MNATPFDALCIRVSWLQQTCTRLAQSGNENTARGETPIHLPIETTGAKFARTRKNAESSELEVHPDPDGKPIRDSFTVKKIKSTVVPHTYEPPFSEMVHVKLTPKDNGTWSNEAGRLEI